MHQLLMWAAEGGESGMLAAIKHNPTFILCNVVVSVVVITIVIERFAFQMGKYRVNSKEFFAQIKKLVVNGNIDRAIKLCDASDYPILGRRSSLPIHTATIRTRSSSSPCSGRAATWPACHRCRP